MNDIEQAKPDVKPPTRNYQKDKFISEERDVIPSRLDLKTRICFMAAVIFSTGDMETMSAVKAVEQAVEIENAANAAVKKMKTDNPIPRTRRSS